MTALPSCCIQKCPYLPTSKNTGSANSNYDARRIHLPCVNELSLQTFVQGPDILEGKHEYRP